ncbi:MAG: hypothetical protein AAF065_11215 [Verrucomicrobiota bacterium]
MKHSTKLSLRSLIGCVLTISLFTGTLAAKIESLNLSDIEAARKALKPSFQNGAGKLTVKEGALEYSVDKASAKDFEYQMFQPARLRASQDFEIIGTFINDTIPELPEELASVGIEVYQATDLSNRVSATVSVARLYNYFSRTAFTQIVQGGKPVESTYSEDLRLPPEVTIKLSYDSKSRVFTTFYDSDQGEEVEWMKVGSFGVGGKGGETGNTNWRMRSSEKLLVYIYGYSENLSVFEGEAQVLSLSVETK